MASSKDYVEFVVECLSCYGGCTIRPMMGEYIVYMDGKKIGDICDDRLLLATGTSADHLLMEHQKEYPYEDSKSLMYLVDPEEPVLEEVVSILVRELPERKRRK